MVRAITYDFLPRNFTSWPSSLKMENDRPEKLIHRVGFIDAVPGSKLYATINTKGKELSAINGFSGAVGAGIYDHYHRYVRYLGDLVRFPVGTFNWRTLPGRGSFTVPLDAEVIGISIVIGRGTAWFDDLKIYQDDKLIYTNDFSNWNPYIGAGAGGLGVGVPTYLYTKNVPIAVGASLVGSLVGAAIGYVISST